MKRKKLFLRCVGDYSWPWNGTCVDVETIYGIGANHILHFQCVQQRGGKRLVGILTSDRLSADGFWVIFPVDQSTSTHILGPTAIVHHVIVTIVCTTKYRTISKNASLQMPVTMKKFIWLFWSISPGRTSWITYGFHSLPSSMFMLVQFLILIAWSRKWPRRKCIEMNCFILATGGWPVNGRVRTDVRNWMKQRTIFLRLSSCLLPVRHVLVQRQYNAVACY